jgi:hypothetical protein
LKKFRKPGENIEDEDDDYGVMVVVVVISRYYTDLPH